MLKKLILLAGLFVLAMPGAALADSFKVKFKFSGGSPTALDEISNMASPATVTDINTMSGSLGSVSFITGTWNDATLGFDPGGSISITSGGNTLFEGFFSGPGTWTLVLFDSATNTATFQYTGAVSGQLDPGLLALLGLPSDYTNGNGTITMFISFVGGSTTGTLISATLDLVATPEPGTMALFGSGLIGLAGAMRRRHKRQKQQAAKA